LKDPHFGISANALKHGIFNRFRMVVNIDALDAELRSSRETVREGPLFLQARGLMHAVFNIVRNFVEESEAKETPEAQIASRFASVPRNLTRRPLLSLVNAAFDGKYIPRYLTYPENLTSAEQKKFLKNLEDRVDKIEDDFITDVKLIALSPEQGIATFDTSAGVLNINILHPFVAYFLEDYENHKQRLPLQIYAMTEVLMEAQLYQVNTPPEQIMEVLQRRDATLRFLARSSGKKTAVHIAQDLQDTASDPNAFELAVVTAFDVMGFNAVPDGRRGFPDGYATAVLAANEDGPQRYKISLEAKSKKDLSNKAKVSAKTVGISGVERQRDDNNCDHAIVIGPDFPTTKKEKSVLANEIKRSNNHTGKTITLVRVADMATLVRVVAAKRVSPIKLRELFKKCSTPEESADWINKLLKDQPVKSDYKKDIIHTIWQLQEEDQNEAPAYAAIRVRLRDKKIDISTQELREECMALGRMTNSIVAYEAAVELRRKPQQVLDEISATFQEYPEDEKKFFKF